MAVETLMTIWGRIHSMFLSVVNGLAMSSSVMQGLLLIGFVPVAQLTKLCLFGCTAKTKIVLN